MRLAVRSTAEVPPHMEDAQVVTARVAEFATGATPASPSDRVLATLMFTDIVNSTHQAVALRDRRWRELLDDYDQLADLELAQFRGRRVNATGDGFLAAFDGPTRAIRCALAVVTAAHQLGIEIRAGLHTGEIETRGEDVAGIAVHLAARVATLSGPSEVVVSRTVKDLVAGSDMSFEDRGIHQLKGIPDGWQIYTVVRRE